MPQVSDQVTYISWGLELLKGSISLVGTMLGGALVLFGGWRADKRRIRAEKQKSAQHESAVLHGAFAVSNFIKERLNDWSKDSRHSRLLRLKIAQSYISQLIVRAPPDSDRIMVALLDVGLRLDALLDIAENIPKLRNSSQLHEYASIIESCASELDTSLELLDVLVTGELPIMSDEEVEQLLSGSNQSA